MQIKRNEVEVQEKEFEKLYRIFKIYIDECLNWNEDQTEIMEAKNLYNKICNLLEKVEV